MHVLIIEDTQDIITSLVRYMALKDIATQVALDGESGLYKAMTEPYDAIILDINLPKKDGLTLCRELREKGNTTPVIMLTSRSANSDIVTGLEHGADDYLVKPFDYEVLVARLEALTRRNLKNKSTTTLRAGDYHINLETREITETNAQASPIHVSQLEFDLLTYFAKNPGVAISRSELYEKVWGEFSGDMMFSKTVDVYIGYLRKKFGRDIIETKKGFGYILR